MKKLFLLFLLLAFALPVNAFNPLMVCTGAVASDACPSGTYTANWDSDHASGFGYICYDSGAGSVNASGDTQDSSADYVEFDAQDEYLQWTDSNVIPSDLVGTLFMTVTFTHVGGDLGTNAIWESYSGNNDNRMACSVDGATKDFFCLFEGDGTASSIQGTTQIGTDEQEYRLGYTWCDGASGCNGNTDAHSITFQEKGTATSWLEQEEAITAWHASYKPNKLTLGNNLALTGVTDNVKIKDVLLLPTYQATDTNY